MMTFIENSQTLINDEMTVILNSNESSSFENEMTDRSVRQKRTTNNCSRGTVFSMISGFPTSGAVVGASIGSMVPGLGTGAGALVGSVVGAIVGTGTALVVCVIS